MFRYIATLAIAGLLLAVALKARSGDVVETDAPAVILPGQPDVRVTRTDAGRDLTILLRCSGAVSHASLVYQLNGEKHTIKQPTSCQKSLDDAGAEDGYTTQVEVKGCIPDGASDIQVVLESETGTRIAPVVLN